MGIVVGIVSIFLGIFIFAQGMASLFIGLPLASKTEARRSKTVYLSNAIWTTIVDIVVIVLMSTVLAEFLVWILICYFIVPLIIFFVNVHGYESEAKEMIKRELDAEAKKAELLYELLNSFVNDEKKE